MTRKHSPAYTLLSHVWEHANEKASFSWERLNHSMRNALGLAIGSGMEFAKGDFAAFYKDFRAGRWISDDEWVYRLAVIVGNTSAIDVFERYKKRGPVVADNVSLGNGYSHGGYLHRDGDRKCERLAIGFSFPWKGETVTVTSMPTGDGPIIACSYKPNPDRQFSNRRILHRYKITVEAIKEERAAVKERDDAELFMTHLVGTVGGPTRTKMLIALGYDKRRSPEANRLAISRKRWITVANKFGWQSAKTRALVGELGRE